MRWIDKNLPEYVPKKEEEVEEEPLDPRFTDVLEHEAFAEEEEHVEPTIEVPHQ